MLTLLLRHRHVMLGLCIWIIVLVVCDSSDRQAMTNVLLRESVRSVLGVHDVHDNMRSSRLYEPSKPARYMMDLYELYRWGSMDTATGNTVRSIHADIGMVNDHPMLVFNLSAITKDETIISAEIHMYKKKHKRHSKFDMITVLVYEVAPQYMTLAKEVRLHRKSRGWVRIRVTEAVKSCASAHRDVPDLLSLTIEQKSSEGWADLVMLKKYVNHHTLPFLVVFSNSSERNISLDHLNSKYVKEKEKRQSGPDVILRGSDGSKVKLKSNLTGTIKTKKNDSDSLIVASGRDKRSIYDNEIPEGPVKFDSKIVHAFHTNPTILLSRKESRRTINHSKLIPYPKNRRKNKKQKRRKNKKLKRRKHKKIKRKKHRRTNNWINNVDDIKTKIAFPDEWEQLHSNKAVIDKDKNECSRKRLSVNFADMGWAEWIISPKSFDAYYCAGSCEFPLTKGLHPSNHASIQSIINAVGIHPDVPAPCCVPDTMSSVTLLYFDEDKNVVLKNYPHMSVTSCACR